jgi:hypothetical protein
MAESVHEQVAAAVQASLAAIVSDNGATYWYTPTVVRTLWFVEEDLLKASVGTPIYAIRPGDETHTEESAQRTDGLMDLYVLVASPFTESETPFAPAASGVTRWTMVNRMVRDVLRKLLTDVQLLSAGGAVTNIFGGPVIVDRDRYVDGWAIAELHFPVSYRYLNGTP